MMDLHFLGKGSPREDRTDNEAIRDHLNLLRQGHRDNAGAGAGSEFTLTEAAQLRFLRHLHLGGGMSEWPDGR